jgi:FKBP-type peptidyl-prolyl cis-trans isomerase
MIEPTHRLQRRHFRRALCAALAIAALAPGATRSAAADASKPTAADSAGSAEPSDRSVAPLVSIRDRVLYAIGVRTAKELRDFALQPAEIELVQRGLRDALLGRDILVNESAFDTELNQFRFVRREAAVTAEQQASQLFLERVAAEDGALVTEAGFVMFELRPGSGPRPRGDSIVRIHFHGRLRDGTVWDSSVESGQPRQVQVNRMFPCFRNGLRRMRLKGRSRIVCPAELAFGNDGTRRVPGGAAVDFEVELLAIVK